MLVFCCSIKEMLGTKVMEDCYMCRRISLLKFLWTGTMLQTCYTLRMCCTKVTDDGYMRGRISLLQCSWNGTML